MLIPSLSEQAHPILGRMKSAIIVFQSSIPSANSQALDVLFVMISRSRAFASEVLQHYQLVHFLYMYAKCRPYFIMASSALKRDFIVCIV